MTGLVIAAGVLLALLLIGQLRVKAAVSYSESGLVLHVKIGPWKIQILPQKPEKKPKKPKKQKPAKKRPNGEVEKRSVKDTLTAARQFIPMLAQAAGHFKRKIQIDRLELHVIWGASDPAAAAMGYGAGNAAIGMLWPILENNFKIKERDLRVDVDFQRKTPALSVRAQAGLTIRQSLSLILRLGVKAIKLLPGSRRESTKQKAVRA